jgi:tetratricopeptide (TPR) repeat protein
MLRSVILLAALAAGCASLPPPEARPLDAGEAALVERAVLAVDLGRPDATERVDELLLAHPASVDGLRLRQVLRAYGGEDWRLFEEARALRRAAPSDPATRYLLARTIPDREEQVRRFRRCLEDDPSFFFGAFGLAAAELALGRAASAKTYALRALAIRPGDAEARCLLAAARAARGPRTEAEDAWRELLRDEPTWPGAALGAARFWSGRGEVDEAASALLPALRAHPGAVPLVAALARVARRGGLREEALREAIAVAGDTAIGHVLRAEADLNLGRPEAGLRGFDAAIRAGVSAAPLAAEVFAAAVLAGDFERAARTWSEGLPALALEAGNLRRAALDDLGASLGEAAADPGRAVVLGRLARALLSAGFAELAVPVAAGALAMEPGNADLAVLAGEAGAWLRFIAAIRERVEQGYGLAAGEEIGADLTSVLESLRSDSRRLLRRDVLGDLTELSLPFAGRILRSDRSEEWLGKGMLLVLGQRAGGPPEAKLMRIVAHFRGRPAGEEEYDLMLGEGAGLEAFGEVAGQKIGGFTLPGFVALDVDVARTWAAEVARIGGPRDDGELWPVRPARRASLWFPGPGLRELARGCREIGVDAALAHVLAHEEGHLLDVDRFYPVLACLPAVLLEVVKRGFSARAIEEGLEERAEAHALASSPDARFALIETLTEATGSGTTAHRPAYRRIIEGFLAKILASPDRYPSVDLRLNLVQQLGRLTDAELDALLAR